MLPWNLEFGVWSFFIALALLGSDSCPAEIPAPSEYGLKAAFLYNFAKFVEWPPKTFSDLASPFAIGIIGDNPFGSNLQSTIENKTLDGHPIVVKPVRDISELKTCQMVFISRSERKRLGEILKGTQGVAALTVSEMDNFLEAGGMIQFLMQERKVRFAINGQAARKAGLKISSKLLNLARHIGKEEGK